MSSSLKKARSSSFLIHGGYVLMLVMLVVTNNLVLTFAGLMIALAGFFFTHQEAKCPKCSAGLLEGGNGLDGVTKMFRLTAAQPIQCGSCNYETVAGDYV